MKHAPFAMALRYQLSSLVDNPLRTARLVVSVFFDPEDEATFKVIQDFRGKLDIIESALVPSRLGRRCIGRNIAALRTEADLVWFTDCDHVFLDGCLDGLVATKWPEPYKMVYPRHLMIQSRHRAGDRMLGQEDQTGILRIDPQDFGPKRYNRAIGGVQIVQGDWARAHGYLNGRRNWMRPAETPFGSFRDDIAYRAFCLDHGGIKGIDLGGLYRIRHSYTSYK